MFCQAWLLSRYMVMARRGLLEGTEDRYGLMSRLGTRDMIPMRRKIRHWQKQFKRRHMFWGLMVLVFMCVLTKFVLLNMFSDQLEWEPVIHSNLLEHKPSSSPNIFSVYKFFVILINMIFYYIINYYMLLIIIFINSIYY